MLGFLGILQCLSSPITSRITLPSDTEEERRRKEIMFPMFVIYIIIGAALILSVRTLNLLTLSCMGCVANGLWGVFTILYFRNLTRGQAELSVLAAIATTIVSDLYLASIGYRMWPQLMLTVNFLVVAGQRDLVCDLALGVITVWLVVTSVEDAMRFGLYDVAWTAPQEEREKLLWCDKDELPCKKSTYATSFVAVLYWTVLVYDFYFTRLYAAQLERDKALMEGSVLAAKNIANFLSEFKLDDAEATLSGEELPADLHECFYNILAHLRLYRPYLPQTCLPQALDSDHEEDFYPARTNTGPSTHIQTTNTKRSATAMSGLSLRSVSSSNPLERSTRSTNFAELKKKSVTVIVTNLKDTLTMLDNCHIVYSRLHWNMTSSAMNIFQRNKGTLDTFVGDTMLASFNAFKPCVNHKIQAIESSLLLQDAMKGHTIHMGVATGIACCGDLGCEGMRRFTTIGRVCAWGLMIQRFAKEIEVPILCDNQVKLDAAPLYPLKVVLQMVLYPKRGGATATAAFLWEVLAQTSSRPPHATSSKGEWLYNLPSNPTLEQYNEAVMSYLLDQPHDARILAVKHPDNHLIEELQDTIRRYGVPPEIDLSRPWVIPEHLVNKTPWQRRQRSADKLQCTSVSLTSN